LIYRTFVLFNHRSTQGWGEGEEGAHVSPEKASKNWVIKMYLNMKIEGPPSLVFLTTPVPYQKNLKMTGHLYFPCK
jgi:hypothetical protein